MKASAYNHFIRAGNRRLAYNAVSNGLALIDDEVVGHISRPGEMTAAHLKWLSFDPFKFPECLSCKIFPICMAGCPDTAMKGGIATGESCERWRYYLDDILRLHAENVRRAKESGKVEVAG